MPDCSDLTWFPMAAGMYNVLGSILGCRGCIEFIKPKKNNLLYTMSWFMLKILEREVYHTALCLIVRSDLSLLDYDAIT